MKFKVDENLPAEVAELLRAAQHDALTVVKQGLTGQPDRHITNVCAEEGRILVTLDLDFADIRTYPPAESPGFIVIRPDRQDKLHIINLFQQVIPLLSQEPVSHHLWIVEDGRIRIRGGGV